jgi:hypothetical protein
MPAIIVAEDVLRCQLIQLKNKQLQTIIKESKEGKTIQIRVKGYMKKQLTRAHL